jgi:hypothetical protein
MTAIPIHLSNADKTGEWKEEKQAGRKVQPLLQP